MNTKIKRYKQQEPKIEPKEATISWDSEYRQESRKLKETCFHSNSSERPSADADVKISQGVSNNNHRDDIDCMC